MRGRALMGEYKGAFAKLDKEFLGTAQGQTGPLVTRLEHLVGSQVLQGIVIGRWAECCQDLHKLIWAMVEARAFHLTRSKGRQTCNRAVNLNSYIIGS